MTFISTLSPLYLFIFFFNYNLDISNAKIDIILYDFDETISCAHMFAELSKLEGYSKNDQLIALNNDCNDECINKIFGGIDRIDRLNQHFNQLTTNYHDIDIGIISFGYRDVIIKALRRINLLQYFKLNNIFGREQLHFSKMYHIKRMPSNLYSSSINIKRYQSVIECLLIITRII